MPTDVLWLNRIEAQLQALQQEYEAKIARYHGFLAQLDATEDVIAASS